MDSSTAVADVDGADRWAWRRHERHLFVLVITSKAPVTLGSSFVCQVVSWIPSYIRPVNSLLEGSLLASSSRGLILTMLSSTSRPRASAQNNVFSQYNIIPTPLANSPFPIAEAPLSKSACQL